MTQLSLESTASGIQSTSVINDPDVKIILETIDRNDELLWGINLTVHQNPELGYQEYKAHDNITSLLENLGFSVTRHAYGLETAFVAEYGSGGRVIAFNAEHDALPGIGHACGHNLIAMMSIGAFLGVAQALKEHQIPGRVRLVGTPAEEGLGGKIKIVAAGGFKDVDACLMTHPGPPDACEGFTGDAYMPTLASHKMKVQYTGQTAHAAVAPWEGVNALDAVVLAYNGISVLRQQIHPSNRVHCVISDGGTRPNVIPGTATLDCYVRSPSLTEANGLLQRVKRCFDGAAIQSGCEIDFELYNTYADLRPNKTICALYAKAMSAMSSRVKCDFTSAGVPGSTDQGNVSYECPAMQSYVSIPADAGCKNHTPGFTAAASTREAHNLCVVASKGMAVAGWNILVDDNIAAKVKAEFEQDLKHRN